MSGAGTGAGSAGDTVVERRHGEYLISSDPARVDATAVHAFLAASYWAEGIPLETVRRSIEHSLCFGVYQGERQVGFARVITDRATFAYLADVYVLDAHRGRGLAKVLVETIMGHPALQGLRRFSLVTRDAHGLYEKFGFSVVAEPGRHMEIARPGLYRSP
ncbi:MAG TPA: GNAT family N-acetyltransferase [Gemmatimonadaceae bacterium]|nr:GNAT family N-acetyltransferase [Gemmatimonadaceae bacterium]